MPTPRGPLISSFFGDKSQYYYLISYCVDMRTMVCIQYLVDNIYPGSVNDNAVGRV